MPEVEAHRLTALLNTIYKPGPGLQVLHPAIGKYVPVPMPVRLRQSIACGIDARPHNHIVGDGPAQRNWHSACRSGVSHSGEPRGQCIESIGRCTQQTHLQRGVKVALIGAGGSLPRKMNVTIHEAGHQGLAFRSYGLRSQCLFRRSFLRANPTNLPILHQQRDAVTRAPPRAINEPYALEQNLLTGFDQAYPFQGTRVIVTYTTGECFHLPPLDRWIPCSLRNYGLCHALGQ